VDGVVEIEAGGSLGRQAQRGRHAKKCYEYETVAAGLRPRHHAVESLLRMGGCGRTSPQAGIIVVSGSASVENADDCGRVPATIEWSTGARRGREILG
jgi:hypothetical protein